MRNSTPVKDVSKVGAWFTAKAGCGVGGCNCCSSSFSFSTSTKLNNSVGVISPSTSSLEISVVPDCNPSKN